MRRLLCRLGWHRTRFHPCALPVVVETAPAFGFVGRWLVVGVRRCACGKRCTLEGWPDA